MAWGVAAGAGEPARQANAGKVTDAAERPVVRVTAALIDGSRVVGTPEKDVVALEAPFTKLNLPFSSIRELEFKPKENTVVCSLRNGDRVTGTVAAQEWRIETLFGRVVVRSDLLATMSVSARSGLSLPKGEGDIEFCDFMWTAHIRPFEIKEGRLGMLPRVMPGYDYGHGGSGRGASITTGVGSEEWKDYSMEVQMCIRGADPQFNPYGLPPNECDGGIGFHVSAVKDSWNEKGAGGYNFSMNARGTWSLDAIYNEHCPGRGYSRPVSDEHRVVARGEGIALDHEKGNRIRVDVVGNRIQIWFDGKQIVDVEDERMPVEIGGHRLDHGGIGFGWASEFTGWISDLTVRRL